MNSILVKKLIPYLVIMFFVLMLVTPQLSWKDRINLWSIIFLAGLLVGMIIGMKRLPHG